MDITVDGTILKGLSIEDHINVKANNVIIDACKVDARNGNYGINNVFEDSNGNPFKGLRVLNTEIMNAQSALVYVHFAVVRKCHLHEGGGDAMKIETGGNTVVERCLMHHTGKNPGAHADGIQIRGGENILIAYNRINYSILDNELGYETNAAIMAGSELTPLKNIQIVNNYLNGGNYTVYMTDSGHGEVTGINISNNLFGRNYRFGVLNASQNNTWNIDGNLWYDTLEWMDINLLDGDNK